MLSREQMEKLASQRPLPTTEPAPDESLDAWWDSVLSDPRAAGKPWLPIQQRRYPKFPGTCFASNACAAFAPSRFRRPML
jgi:hypothetical protein